MKMKNHLFGDGLQGTVKLLLLLVALAGLNVSCSDSDSTTEPTAESPVDVVDTTPPPDTSDDQPVLQVYSETGDTGMRVTYSPATLTAHANVEELEAVYSDLMACVGLSSAASPSILLTADESLFFVRADGTDIRGYYDIETDNVVVFAEDLSEEFGNRFWWTRHGMIEYLIAEHNLLPDSTVSPFLQCHWDDA